MCLNYAVSMIEIAPKNNKRFFDGIFEISDRRGH